MKHLKTLLFAAAIFVGATSFTTAQSKIAHVNKQDIVKSLPGYKSAQSELEKMGKTLEAEYQASIKELETKLAQYDAEAAAQTQEENGKRMQEVEGMKQSLAQFQQQAQQQLQKKEVDLLNPLLEKVDMAIKKVGNTQGFDYVMDAAIFIMANGKDITADVKSSLGI